MDSTDYDIINETASTGDAWIRQPKQALVTQISSTKLRPRVMLGFHSPDNPRDSDIINETESTGDAWIRQPIQPLGTHKLSTNCCHG